MCGGIDNPAVHCRCSIAKRGADIAPRRIVGVQIPVLPAGDGQLVGRVDGVSRGDAIDQAAPLCGGGVNGGVIRYGDYRQSRVSLTVI